ncbi:hypothetical protein GIB67_014214 [Kingdonia uniflora]|uniref:Pentatricopeptide repeat-containing protein n=1 Tax=Kingdonia uniflora TaxID=39325 RepID=A0A7J7M1V0_9MAGN|nr:hypothetical protein GIB67_014214 [Kingdonia uniflora]
MYCKRGLAGSACDVFEQNPQSKGLTVCYNALLAGNALYSRWYDGMCLFREMCREGIAVNEITMLGLIAICTLPVHLRFGMSLHVYNVKCGVGNDELVANCLITMCFKCGAIELSRKVFDEMPEKGLMECDDLGAGRLEEARDLITSMPMKPDGVVWGTLLGACKIHVNVELAELAFEQVVKLEPANAGYYVLLSNIYTDADNSEGVARISMMMRLRKLRKELAFEQVVKLEPANAGYYVLLSNIYTDADNSEGVARISMMMRLRKLRKEPGCSYVECKNRIHLIMAGDKTCPQANEIYKMLE